MLEIVEGLPDYVIGILAKGRVTRADCDSVLRPVLESSLRRDVRPRLYYEIGCRFPGAGWQDLEVGLDRLPQWERIAVVTDTAWVRQTVNALRFLLASEVRVFSTVEAAEGRARLPLIRETAITMRSEFGSGETTETAVVRRRIMEQDVLNSIAGLPSIGGDISAS
jgi:hypothetical protein